jgi:hypothetical protein
MHGALLAKGAEVAAMLKAVHAQEDRQAALQKARLVIEKITTMHFQAAARTVEKHRRDSCLPGFTSSALAQDPNQQP